MTANGHTGVSLIFDPPTIAYAASSRNDLFMKAMMMKGVATVLTPLDSVPPASRNAPRAVAQPKRQAGFPAPPPPGAEARDPNVLEPTNFRFFFITSPSPHPILILFYLIFFSFLFFFLDLP